MEKPSRLRRLWNKLSGKNENENADGTITTKHGNHIIPHRVFVSDRGGISNNMAAFMSQPRVRELKQLMAPLLKTRRGDIFLLDEETGDFYLQSDVKKQGAENAKPLGQIDMAVELPLFKHASQMVMMKKMFGDASYDNPIVLDERTGNVYPKNDPKNIRGQVKLGPSVAGPAASGGHQKRRKGFDL